jgi:hypothetical protein
VTPSVAGGQPARRYNPISQAVAHPVKKDAETSSPAETIGRPIGEAAAGPHRPVLSTCVNAHNARAGKGYVPTWLETPGGCRALVSRAAPSGAIPSERSLGRDVGILSPEKFDTEAERWAHLQGDALSPFQTALRRSSPAQPGAVNSTGWAGGGGCRALTFFADVVASRLACTAQS